MLQCSIVFCHLLEIISTMSRLHTFPDPQLPQVKQCKENTPQERERKRAIKKSNSVPEFESFE
eukprot:c15325_g1_i1 orf=245-433(-)